MIDQEPRRSVQLIRRIDTRIPGPLLSAFAGIGSTGGSAGGNLLGKLATDMRSSARPIIVGSVGSRPSVPVTGTAGAGRGWTSVVTKAPQLAAPGSAGPSRTTPGPMRTLAPPSAPSLIQPVLISNGEDVPDSWEDDL